MILSTSTKGAGRTAVQECSTRFMHAAATPKNEPLLAISKRKFGNGQPALRSANIGSLPNSIFFSLAVWVQEQSTLTSVMDDIVEEFGHHGLLCIRSADRISRYKFYTFFVKLIISNIVLTYMLLHVTKKNFKKSPNKYAMVLIKCLKKCYKIFLMCKLNKTFD